MKRRTRLWLRRAGIVLVVALGATLGLGRLAGFGCAGKLGPTAAGPVVEADLMAGDWTGTWNSDNGSMSGPLRCRVERQTEGVYLARFEATFAKFLTDNSSTTLRVQNKGQAWEFTGEEDLGLLKGGKYKYKGQSDGREFVCNYDSAFNKGTFRLKRAEQAAATPASR